MKRIGILGGTFDPPHLGHLIIANEVLHAKGLDEVWFMPNQEPPHKEKSHFLRNEDRVSLLRRAVSDHPQFQVELVELERTGPSYTVDTIKLLHAREQDTEFFFIIGADMVEYLHKWRDIEQLLDLVTFVGVKRPDFQLTTTYPVDYVDIPEIGISSSLIRERLQNGRTIKYLVPENVRTYMEENHLYES